MKKALINIILALLAIAGIAYAAVCNGLQFLIGFTVAYPAMLGLVKLNTNWLEEY